MKEKTVYTCSVCLHAENKWYGKCPACNSWNSFIENTVIKKKNTEAKIEPQCLDSIKLQKDARIDTQYSEINRVFGSGIMKGSVILLGGEPGIGKSTLMLQLLDSIEQEMSVLYVSAEESAPQLKLRAQRLGIKKNTIEVLCAAELNSILTALQQTKYSIVIIDSIQTIHSQEVGSPSGSFNQVKYCCQEIIEQAKTADTVILFVAHVTKEGFIAGPKMVEHMVDTVLYFEDADGQLRILRAMKNRFGSVDEIGIFRMGEKGLEELSDPTSVFLNHRRTSLPPGIIIVPVYEGTRVLMVEIQALTVPAKSSISRVFSERIDSGRVARIAAVLEKHCKLRFSDQDIYINVAGGIRIAEVGIELALAAALFSARTEIPVPEKTMLCGEVTLAGEIRPVIHLKKRWKTAQELGFSRGILPETKEDKPEDSTQLYFIENLQSCITLLFGPQQKDISGV